MEVVLIPGPRNEELVQEILKKKLEFMEDEAAWADYVTDLVGSGEEYFDALYYACENGDEVLVDQARYLHDCLLNEENYYFASRMGGFDTQ